MLFDSPDIIIRTMPYGNDIQHIGGALRPAGRRIVFSGSGQLLSGRQKSHEASGSRINVSTSVAEKTRGREQVFLTRKISASAIMHSSGAPPSPSVTGQSAGEAWPETDATTISTAP